MIRRQFFKSALGIAIAAVWQSRSSVIATRVRRSECTVCKGTGRVKAGDSVVVVDRECDNCIPDPPKQCSPVPELPPEPPRRRIVMLTNPSCTWCKVLENNVLRRLKNVEIVKQHDNYTTTLPTCIFYEGDREYARVVGAVSYRQFCEKFYYDKKTASQLRKWCRENNVERWYVKDMPYVQHMTSDAHDIVFMDWQLEGLTQDELMQLHGAQHLGLITP